jgi:hypothetical protein
MKINNFFYLLIFLLSNIDSRFGRGGGQRFGGRNKGSMGRTSGRSGGRSSGRSGGKHNSSNHYSHGGGRNNFNRYTGYGNFGSFGGSAAWGLGGLGMGLLLGGMMGSSSRNNNGNVTIINSYDNKGENKDNTNNNYETIVNNLKSEIDKIKSLSKTINDAQKEIKSNHIPAIIESYFAPYEKIEIIERNSNELYGDFKKEKVKIVNFKDNQEIKMQIERIRKEIEPNLNTLISLTDNNNKNKLEAIQNDLRTALKILNANLVDTVKKIQQ